MLDNARRLPELLGNIYDVQAGVEGAPINELICSLTIVIGNLTSIGLRAWFNDGIFIVLATCH